jgi:hypothetical protein
MTLYWIAEMLLNINAKDYKSLHDVLSMAKDQAPYKRVWAKLHKEYGIGKRSPCGGSLLLTASDRRTSVNAVKSDIDIDPRKFSFDDLSVMTRTESGVETRFEKLFSLAPRELFIETRDLDLRKLDVDVPPGYQGSLVSNVLLTKPSIILSIENFDTFSSLQAKHLKDVTELKDKRVTCVFVGDNKATPTAVKLLRKHHIGTWLHFGDYDPAGIAIAHFKMAADAMLLPSLLGIGDRNFYRDLSDDDLFHKQCKQWVAIKNSNYLMSLEHIKEMNLHQTAITQEVIIARSLKLESITLS